MFSSIIHSVSNILKRITRRENFLDETDYEVVSADNKMDKIDKIDEYDKGEGGKDDEYDEGRWYMVYKDSEIWII